MTKTDELISKLEEYINLLEIHTLRYDLDNPSHKKLKSEISELKEQVEKDEQLPPISFEEIKFEIAKIQYNNLILSEDKSAIEANPATHKIAIYIYDILKKFNSEEQIKKEEVNSGVMSDTCCGKYEEEQPLKSIRDKLNPQLTQIGKEPQYITNARESFKCKKEEVIGFDVLDRLNKKCFDDTLENIKKSMKDKEQSLKSAEEIKQQFCNELESILLNVRLGNYKTDDGDTLPLVDHLSEIGDNTISSGKEEISNIVEQIYFRLGELSIFSKPSIKDTTNLPYPDPISKHQTDINIGWMRAMKYMKDQPVNDITDEEIEKEFPTDRQGIKVKEGFDEMSYEAEKVVGFIRGINTEKQEGAKWMRSKMKSL